MIRQLVKRRRRRILVDVNTQKDYFLADGKACIGNHRRVLAHIRRMLAWARHNSIAVISTCEVYPGGNGNGVNYCIDGTDGQKKIHYALLNRRISFPADGSMDLPADLFRRYQQVILHKRCADPFAEPRIERLLTELWAGEFIIVGASTEGAVKAMALGLLQRAKKVTVVADAVGSHNKREAELALRKMKAKGAKLVETKKIAGTSRLKYVGACRCTACQGQTGRQKHPANQIDSLSYG